MLFKRLPDPNVVRPAFLAEEETIVVHDRSTQIAYGRHSGPLSLKATLRGVEAYNVHGFFEDVAPGDILITNTAQSYESRIDSDKPVETLSIFFSAKDLRFLSQICLSDADLLDAPGQDGGQEFCAVKSRADEDLFALIAALPRRAEQPALAGAEHIGRILHAMQRQEKRQRRNASTITAARPATRAELLRRCRIGKAYIDAAFAEDLTLDAIAKAANLSRAHFLRAFTASFGQTPYQALRARRLAEAERLIRSGTCSVSEAAVAVGYANFSAFSRAFKAVYGTSPSSLAP
jgi:AraC-like DNA-binding protein